MYDIIDIVMIAFNALVLLGTIALYVWLWRGRMLLGELTGFRLEEQRRQVREWSKQMLPVIGLLIVNMAMPILDLWHVSRGWHMFWTGVIITSDIWLCGIVLSVALARMRQEQAAREARSESNASD